ncbi:hypothetical protein FPV67DRAFT_1669396 [Lyophyllum atratum]|nr:hypothetical protein FPV67DRAFT_1669396 [Lyophyllum atratum]
MGRSDKQRSLSSWLPFVGAREPEFPEEEDAVSNVYADLLTTPEEDSEWTTAQEDLDADKHPPAVISDSEESIAGEDASDAASDTDSGMPANDPFSVAAELSLRGQPAGNFQRRGKYAAYLVTKGRVPGIYLTWDAALDQISGFSHNSYKGYRTIEEAQAAWHQALANSTTGPPGSSQQRLVASSLPRASGRRVASSQSHASKQHAPSPTVHSVTPTRDAVRFSVPSHDGVASTSRQPTPHIHDGAPVLDDEDLFFAVIQGRAPGVYQGRSAATRAAGCHGGVIRKAPTSNAANCIFVTAFMAGSVWRNE